MKECNCLCKETSKVKGIWKGLTRFRIAELDVLRGLPGYTDINFVLAKDKDEAIKKYYDLSPGASERILIYPEGCAEVYIKPKAPKVNTVMLTQAKAVK